METLLLDRLRHPPSGLVQLYQPLLHISDLDEPAVEAAIHKRSLTTPAERIAMLDSAVGKETALTFEVLNDLFVCILDVDALVSFNCGQELAISINRDWSSARLNDASTDTRLVIILTESRGTMNHSSTSVLGDE